MAKQEQQDARKTAGTLATGSKETSDKNIYGGGAFGPTGLMGTTADAKTRQGTTFDAAQSGFAEGQKTGGYDAGQLEKLRGATSKLADTGGYDPGNLSTLRQSLADSQKSGGYDPGNLDYLRSSGKSLAETGGYDPEQLKTIRGGYSDLANNGGFTDQESQNFRNRATESVDTTYNVLQDQLQRARAATGGLGAGGDYGQMARHLGQDSAAAALHAEDSLATQKRTGRLQGLTGLGTTEQNLAANKGSALTGLGNLESGVASGGRDIMGQQGALETNVAGGVRAGVGAQAGLEGSVAGGKLASNAGQAGLFNTETGEISDMGNKILQQLGLEGIDQRAAASLLTQLSNNPGLFDNILRVTQAASGAALGAAGLGARPFA